MKTIYIIEKGWIDPMENRNADGYIPVGYMESEDVAKAFCESAGYFTSQDCWSIKYMKNGVMPKYKYTPLNLMK